MTSSGLRRAAVLAAVAALAAACKGADYWSDRLQAEPLYRRAEQVRSSPSCAKLVPLEFGRTFPVPVAGKRFEVLYYPLFVSPGKSEAMTPAFAARFARDSSAPDVCTPLAAAPARSLGRAVPAGLSMKAYYKADARLFASSDKTAALYFSGAPASAADKAVLGEFVDAFTTIAEPGMRDYYYLINPDFWEWLRREAGKSLAAPAPTTVPAR
jgi:hypothetical protein